MKDFFSPEFRNRLSATVEFAPLGLKDLERIVKIQIEDLNTQLAGKKVKVKLSKEARRHLARLSQSEEFGAREIARVIDEKIKESLTDAILFGPLKQGGTVRVVLDETDDLHFTFES